MKTYNIALVGLLAGLGLAGAQSPAAQTHPKQHTDQFMKQCMEAHDNRTLCKCAQNVYIKHVPAGRGRLERHPRHDQPVLNLDKQHLESLVPEIERCEQKHAKRDQSKTRRNQR